MHFTISFDESPKLIPTSPEQSAELLSHSKCSQAVDLISPLVFFAGSWGGGDQQQVDLLVDCNP